MATANPGEHGNGDQRVTNALIAHKIDALTELVKEHISRDERVWQEHDGRLRSLEAGQTERKIRIDNLEGEVNRLRAKSDTWNFANSVATAIAGILAYIGWGK